MKILLLLMGVQYTPLLNVMLTELSRFDWLDLVGRWTTARCGVVGRGGSPPAERMPRLIPPEILNPRRGI